MNVKIVIPARLGSTRLPNKTILPLVGKPIVLHVVERCIEAGFATDDIFIATDDNTVIDKLSNSPVDIILTAKSHTSGTDRINEVAKKLQWESDTIVINVQGDEPMIPPSLIRNLAYYTQNNHNFDIYTAVTPITSVEQFNNKNVVKAILGTNDKVLYFTRAAAPENRDNLNDLSLAKRHIGIYAYTVSSLNNFCSFEEDELEACEKLEQLRALRNGMAIGTIVYKGQLPHGIDTIEDYIQIEKLMNEKQNG